MVDIVEVKTKVQLRKFRDYPDKLYADCPHFVPELKGDETEALTPGKNPALDSCEARYFLAMRDGRIVGRIAGIINNAANDKWGTKRIRFSRMDFIDDHEVSAALIKTVEDWGKSRGLTEIHGPIGFNDIDKEGLLIEGFDRLSMFITIYNHPYYKEHLERLGYAKDVDWNEYIVHVPKEGDETIDRLHRLSEVVLKRNKLRLYGINKISEAKPVVIQLFDLLNACYEGLYGTVPWTPDLAHYYFNKFKPILNPEYAQFVVDENDRLVGFGLAAPSMAEAARKCGGRLFPFGFVPILKALKGSEVVELYLIGVLPEYQNAGVPAILLDAVLKNAMKNGVKLAETGPELETNEKVQSLWKFFDRELVRRRRCFIKTLDE